MGLHKYGVLLGIQSQGQQQGKGLVGPPTKLRRHLPHRHGMEIHHAVIAIVFRLKVLPISKRANVVAQGQPARGLNP